MSIQFTNYCVTYFMDSNLFLDNCVYGVFVLRLFIIHHFADKDTSITGVYNCGLKDIEDFISLLVLFDYINLDLLFAYLHFCINRQVFFLTVSKKRHSCHFTLYNNIYSI